MDKPPETNPKVVRVAFVIANNRDGEDLSEKLLAGCATTSRKDVFEGVSMGVGRLQARAIKAEAKAERAVRDCDARLQEYSRLRVNDLLCIQQLQRKIDYLVAA